MFKIDKPQNFIRNPSNIIFLSRNFLIFKRAGVRFGLWLVFKFSYTIVKTLGF